MPRSVFCAAMPIMIFDRFGELQMPTRNFAKRGKKRKIKKEKKTCADRPERARARPTKRASVCALFILFLKVAKKRMYTIFVRYALENLTGQQLERKDNDMKQ